MSKRRQHSAEFKARVALEAVQGLKTVHAIAQEYHVHPVQISQWKKELPERLPEVFGRKLVVEREELLRQKEQLERKVGELTMDVEFLKKSAGNWGFRWTGRDDRAGTSSFERAAAESIVGGDRGRVYRPRRGRSEEDLALMRWMDEVSLEDPTAGARRCRDLLRLKGQRVSRKRLQRLRRIMGLEGVRPRRRLSVPDIGGQRFTYLLEDLEIVRPNQVWCADITYVPMRGGFMYLTAILDWYSRKVLGWNVSNTLDTQSGLLAFEMALAHAGGRPEVVNTDQGCQFTSAEWIERVRALGAQVSMDGKGRRRDNIVVERFWWSLKHEDVYLRDYATVPELKAGIEAYIRRYNTWRPHQALGGMTPQMAYEGKMAHVA